MEVVNKYNFSDNNKFYNIEEKIKIKHYKKLPIIIFVHKGAIINLIIHINKRTSINESIRKNISMFV
jgi:hypothetical protein